MVHLNQAQSDSQLLIDKYFPKNFDEFVGNVEIVDYVKNWAVQWSKGVKQKPLLFFGPPGCGKTALALLVAKEMNWQIFETSASSMRDKESVERIVGAATGNASLFGNMRLVLLDEIDALQSQDRGGASAIMTIIKQATNPIILTANDIYGDKKILPLRTLADTKEFKKINYLSIAKRLREICALEKIEFEDDAIKELAKNSGGDFRSAILDIEGISAKITMADVKNLMPRERKEKIFSVMTKIFKGKTIQEIQSAAWGAEVDSDFLSLWVEENIPRQFDVDDTAKAFNYLSRADVFGGRIFRRQNYGFLRYKSFLSTVAVGLSKSKDYSGWTPFQFPSFVLGLSSSSAKRETRKSVAAKVGEKTHCSRNQAMQEFYFTQFLLENKETAPSVAAFYGFDEKELAFLLETKPDTKKVENLLKEAQALEKKVVVERMHGGKQRTLFG